MPVVNSQWALLIGGAFRLIVGEIEIKHLSKICKWLLQVAVVTLGFCINIHEAIDVGANNFLFITISVIVVMLAGFGLSKSMRLDKNLSLLISSGTAICGGSAIASVSPVLKASGNDISIALTVVFALNALAVLIFPGMGTILQMNQNQFGLWCAVAIHDTSSVVGAAAVYGQQALELATTAKLARMLWIVPLMIALSIFKGGDSQFKFPWFILFFVLALVIGYSFSLPETLKGTIFDFSKALMALVLFLIGSTFKVNRATKIKPIVFGISLWVFIVVVSGYVILNFY